MNIYAGPAGDAIRNAERATALALETDRKRRALPWWRFGARRTMKDNADFWAGEARRFCAVSARLDGEM